MLEGLKPASNKKKNLLPKDETLNSENERLRSVIVLLTKKHAELKKKFTIRRTETSQGI